jgi:HD-GYP domain-containing protein (c-di-GMP phosphodiesterase class II)
VVLKRVAKLIENECPANGIVARIGGDEFLILLPRTGPEVAESLVNRIEKSIAGKKVGYINLSVSLGWASKTEEDQNFEEIYRMAEDKMYRHKLYESPSMRSNTIKTIIQTLHEKLPGEQEHSQRVSLICERIGRELGFSQDRIAELKIAALVHDIGKIAVDDAVLHKPGSLNPVECEQMKKHSETGYRILSSVNDMAYLANYVLSHHENWDGSGYPTGLIGEQIPLESRIIRIADAYDAMTHLRCYGDVLSHEQAKEEIRSKMGSYFDPNLAQIFLDKVADQL